MFNNVFQGEDKKSDLYWEQDFYHPNGNIVYDCQGYSIKGSGMFFRLFFQSDQRLKFVLRALLNSNTYMYQ